MTSETDNEQGLSNCERHPTASAKIRAVPRPESSQTQLYFIMSLAIKWPGLRDQCPENGWWSQTELGGNFASAT